MTDVTERSKGVPQRRFRPYPEYRDSRVEYLGQVPAHWAVYPLRRRLFREAGSIKIGPFGSALKLEFMVPEGFKVYGQEHVIARDFSRGSKYVDETKFAELGGCEIQSRDLLITMMGSSGRCVAVPDGIETGIMDSHLIRIRLPDADLPPEFVALLIDEADYVRDQIQAAGKGAIMHGLNSSIIKAIVMAVPPIAEQLRILDCLDRETAKIDALVARKERLIELLQEKRTALITRAVTRGLDPNVPMKDSGVEWLGEIPAHWAVKKTKRLCLVRRGASPRPIDDPIYFDDAGEYSWVRIADVTASERYLELTTQRLSRLGKSKSVPLEPGELFLSIAATVGKPIVTRIKCCIHDGFVYFVGLRENREYLFFLFFLRRGIQGTRQTWDAAQPKHRHYR